MSCFFVLKNRVRPSEREKIASKRPKTPLFSPFKRLLRGFSTPKKGVSKGVFTFLKYTYRPSLDAEFMRTHPKTRPHPPATILSPHAEDGSSTPDTIPCSSPKIPVLSPLLFRPLVTPQKPHSRPKHLPFSRQVGFCSKLLSANSRLRKKMPSTTPLPAHGVW